MIIFVLLVNLQINGFIVWSKTLEKCGNMPVTIRNNHQTYKYVRLIIKIN